MTDPNPYRPPEGSDLDERRPESEVPVLVLKDIRYTWMAAAAYVVWMLFNTLWMVGTSAFRLGIDDFLDPIIVVGLAIGIYFRSRVCAVLLLLQHVVVIGFSMYLHGSLMAGLLPGLVFFYYFANGVEALFRYHKIRRTA